MEIELYEQSIGRKDNEVRRRYNYLTDLRNKFKEIQQQIGQTRNTARLKELHSQLKEYATQIANVFRAIQPSSVSQLEGGANPSTICSLLEIEGFIRNEQLEMVCKLYGKKMFSSNDKIVKEIMDEYNSKGNPHRLTRIISVWLEVHPISGDNVCTIELPNVVEYSMVQDYENQIIELFKTQSFREHGQLFDKMELPQVFRQTPLIRNTHGKPIVIAVFPE